MSLFSEDEIAQIRNVLKEDIKQNGKIKDSYYIIKDIDDKTDFERFKYTKLENVVKQYIQYENGIDNSNIKDFILDIEALEYGNEGVFTKTNTVVSAITLIGMFLIAIATDSLFLLIAGGFGILWAYLSRYIGLKKGIYTGYVWGYFLGLIGFIVMCVLKGDDVEIQKENTGNKYDDLEKLMKLKEQGAITEEEFIKEKNRILK